MYHSIQNLFKLLKLALLCLNLSKINLYALIINLFINSSFFFWVSCFFFIWLSAWSYIFIFKVISLIFFHQCFLLRPRWLQRKLWWFPVFFFFLGIDPRPFLNDLFMTFFDFNGLGTVVRVLLRYVFLPTLKTFRKNFLARYTIEPKFFKLFI